MEPRRVHEVVHTLRQKPVHVRENIAVGVAGGITVIVTVLWFVANASAGTFSLAPATNLATNAPDVKQAVSTGKDSVSQLLGAAASAVGATSSPANIEIVNTEVHSTLDQDQPDPNATVIHF